MLRANSLSVRLYSIHSQPFYKTGQEHGGLIVLLVLFEYLVINHTTYGDRNLHFKYIVLFFYCV